MNETKQTQFKKRALAIAVASCVSLVPLAAGAAGLGKLTVLSGLGQPLRAELDIGAAKEELAGMSARLAPQDAFKQAGVDFSSVLLDLRFSVENRPGGTSVVKVTSSKPINEPFLDFLVELTWPAGRLVREYTFLLDPPEIAARQSTRSVAEAKVVETVRGSASADSRSGVTRPTTRPMVPRAESEPKAKEQVGGTRVVRSGETLRKIAGETQYPGVSLEQMLVGLFRKNPDAFIGENINRLKAGAILNLPEKAAVQAVPESEAKKVYLAHASDWNSYRQKLAASTAKAPAAHEDAAAGQASSGKITAKVDEKVPPAEQAKDQVKVSRAETSGKAGAAPSAADKSAEQIAKDKALKEAQERLATLEKNVDELQKLLELKSQKLAELQQAPAKKEENKPPETPKVAEAPKAEVSAEVAQSKPVEEVKPVEPVKPEAAKPVEAPPKPKVVAPPAAPVPEPPSFVDSLMEDPLPLAAGGGVLALLAGYFLLKRRRSQSSEMETTAAPMPSSLGPNSVFRMTGGQSVDTGNTPPHTGEFSQTGPGTIDTDEVDPVAEADVYMAYGRDTQAEEILLEALQKDPQRTAIHAKLLEIYANRRSVKQFETLASELYAQTGGVGPEWAKVAALGLGLDPANPLYSGSQAAGSESPAVAMAAADIPTSLDISSTSDAMMPSEGSVPNIELPEEFERNTMVMPKAADALPESIADEETAPEQPDVSDAPMTLDFDLGEQTIAPDLSSEVAQAAEDQNDFDATIVDDGNRLDFDLGVEMPLPEVEVAAPEVIASAEKASADSGLDFNFDLPVEQSAVNEEASVEGSPDFSPEGTLVVPRGSVGEDVDVGLGTWVGVDETTQPAADKDISAPVDDAFEQRAESAMTQTVVNPLAGTDTLVNSNILNFDDSESNSELANTVVNSNIVDTDSLEFDVKLTDSMFLGQPMPTPEFDIGSINLDLAAEPPASSSVPESPTEAAAPVAEAVVKDAQWEEVNTKLDLAKAYEEMGDMEGARELLQEVISDGPADLVEQAQAIMGRIGG